MMWKNLAASASGIALLFSSTPVHAEWSATTFIAKIEAGDAESVGYLEGIVSGLLWANAMLETQGQKPLYCQPDRLSLTLQQDVQILRDYLKRYPKLSDNTLGGVMLMALKDTFPCKDR